LGRGKSKTEVPRKSVQCSGKRVLGC